eukprot:NODE_3836_length_518_cov_7.597015_g3266_i0.p1 GENE.NODE_3836_length_518_cov_7.597015_g3266_i0~~NODE_3836_length_518_cov_7.597015_g3266_i0.p1  ORF type:complete len:146 (+),score=19.30 NODE_3836_length_518_cov_7.597015_g3266_i0:78-515(+)
MPSRKCAAANLARQFLAPSQTRFFLNAAFVLSLTILKTITGVLTDSVSLYGGLGLCVVFLGMLVLAHTRWWWMVPMLLTGLHVLTYAYLIVAKRIENGEAFHALFNVVGMRSIYVFGRNQLRVSSRNFCIPKRVLNAFPIEFCKC